MATEAQTPDLVAIKGRQQQTWASGDYAIIGSRLVVMAEALAEAVDLRAGQKVLDLATGTGNAALAAARRGCAVTGIDYVPALLGRARARAAAEGWSITFLEGDVEDVPFPDASYDVVLSTLGVMFAPDQARVARELLRVCRPHGKIGLACWTPDGFVGQMFRLTGQYAPPPAGVPSPMRWGTEDGLCALLGEGIASLEVKRRHFVFRYPSAQHWLDTFRTYYGPTMKAFERLDPARREALARDLLGLAHRFNRSGDGTLAVPSEYLEAVIFRL